VRSLCTFLVSVVVGQVVIVKRGSGLLPLEKGRIANPCRVPCGQQVAEVGLAHGREVRGGGPWVRGRAGSGSPA